MKKQSVLIVEDDEAIRELYQTALEAGGLEVITAADGKSAVEIALQKHPDVILMDIMLPDMDGHAAVEKIRIDDWGKKAKIIFLTNMDDPKNISEAVAEGSSEYIIKAHTTPKEVVNMVRIASHM